MIIMINIQKVGKTALCYIISWNRMLHFSLVDYIHYLYFYQYYFCCFFFIYVRFWKEEMKKEMPNRF